MLFDLEKMLFAPPVHLELGSRGLCLDASDGWIAALTATVILRESHQQGLTLDTAGVTKVAAMVDRASPAAVRGAQKLGINLSGHRRQHVDSVQLSLYNFIVPIGFEAREYVFGRQPELPDVRIVTFDDEPVLQPEARTEDDCVRFCAWVRREVRKRADLFV